MTKFASIVLILSALFLSAIAQKKPSREDRFRAKWESNPLVQRRSRGEDTRLQNLRRDVFENGCVANLCFLLEGSDEVSDVDLTNMKNFVDLIVAITTTDDPGNYCAAEYSNSFKPIAFLTQRRIPFLDAVQNVQTSGGRANLAAGISFALKQLARQDINANNIIFFSKTEPKARQLPLGLTRFFRRGGVVSAVALTDMDFDILARYTGDLNRVVPLDGFFDISELVVAVVTDVCGLPCGTRLSSQQKVQKSSVDCPRRLGERPTKPGQPGHPSVTPSPVEAVQRK